MKDFFTQCMNDLYAMTGIEQVRWMLNDTKMENGQLRGERDFDLCVSAMVNVSKQFNWIPEEDQQTIIRKMMLEDKNYKGLNSRTIWAWLDLHKDVYFRGQTHFKEIEHDPAPPEIADKYLKQWTEDLAKIGNPEAQGEGIKNLRVKQMKEQYGKAECKHTGQFIEDEKGRICCDCGKELTNEK